MAQSGGRGLCSSHKSFGNSRHDASYSCRLPIALQLAGHAPFHTRRTAQPCSRWICHLRHQIFSYAPKMHCRQASYPFSRTINKQPRRFAFKTKRRGCTNIGGSPIYFGASPPLNGKKEGVSFTHASHHGESIPDGSLNSI